MNTANTAELLADYVKTGSEMAFRALVARYVNSVHSTALRLVGGDAQLAEDITQMVFANLARKAHTLPPAVVLGGWLHRDACFAARTAMRGERRRQFRERQAIAMNIPEDHTQTNLAMVAPILDEAINQLEPDDRAAILLRFFEQLEFRAVGEKLGSTEDAARMRVNRALEKLQALLKNRGVTLSAAALGTMLAVGFVSAAPLGLAASIAGTALAAGTTGGFAAPFLKFMSMTNLKIAALSVVAVAALAASVVVQHQSIAKLRDENLALQQQAAQVVPLQEQNQHLSNQVARARTGPAPEGPQVHELARLRNEVASLRQQTNDLERQQATLHQGNRGQLAVRRMEPGVVGKRVFKNMPMQGFANFVGSFLNASVADQTGLIGTYDIELSRPAVGGQYGMLERIRGILQSELGLQLVPFAGPFPSEANQYQREGSLLLQRVGDLTLTNVLPEGSINFATNGGFAIRLDHPNAPGLQPGDGGHFQDDFEGINGRRLRNFQTNGLSKDVIDKLRLIDSAKQQWVLEFHARTTDIPTWEKLARYLATKTGDMNAFTNAPEGVYFIKSTALPPEFIANPTAKQVASVKSQDECVNHLTLIDSAKQQWALEHDIKGSDMPKLEDLKPYLASGPNAEDRFKELTTCPDGGVYTIEHIGEKPTCSIPGHVLP